MGDENMEYTIENEREKISHIVNEVLIAEEEKLHLERPRGIIDQIEKIIKNTIRT